jgi:hypothetical protein
MFSIGKFGFLSSIITYECELCSPVLRKEVIYLMSVFIVFYIAVSNSEIWWIGNNAPYSGARISGFGVDIIHPPGGILFLPNPTGYVVELYFQRVQKCLSRSWLFSHIHWLTWYFLNNFFIWEDAAVAPRFQLAIPKYQVF